MRIVAGRWRGRRIAAPPGKDVRPTLDRVREAWMSIVQPWLPAARVLDLYAGSGALGLEALSRGARSADLVEKDPRVLRVLEQNIATLGAQELTTVHRADALRYVAALGAEEYEVAFADPPYASGAARALAERWLQTPFATVFGIEHSPGEELPGEPAVRKYGSAAIAFYQAAKR